MRRPSSTRSRISMSVRGEEREPHVEVVVLPGGGTDLGDISRSNSRVPAVGDLVDDPRAARDAGVDAVDSSISAPRSIFFSVG